MINLQYNCLLLTFCLVCVAFQFLRVLFDRSSQLMTMAKFKVGFVPIFLVMVISIGIWNYFVIDVMKVHLDNAERQDQPLFPNTSSKQRFYLELQKRHFLKEHHKDTQPTELSNSNVYYSRIVYNRVGKCGSRSMQSVITKLAKQNGFEFYMSPISNQTRLGTFDLLKEVQLIANIKSPMLYSRHIYYIGFEKFGVVPPIYINMIRDPIERFSSQYHFKRNGDGIKPGVRAIKPMQESVKDLDINDCVLKNYSECSVEKLWYIVPYFCGHSNLCRRPSYAALQRAKQHLLDNYLAVGFVEDFEGTLKVFEKLLPAHFKGALQVWEKISSETRERTSTNNKNSIQPEVRKILQNRMQLEYDFYNFAKKLFSDLKAELHILR